MKRHFKDYSIHLTDQIDTFLSHCQLNDLMLFTLLFEMTQASKDDHQIIGRVCNMRDDLI